MNKTIAFLAVVGLLGMAGTVQANQIAPTKTVIYQAWEKILPGVRSLFSAGPDKGVDSSGNVIMVNGLSTNGSWGLTVSKFMPGGQQAWSSLLTDMTCQQTLARNFPFEAKAMFQPVSLRVDANDNIYLLVTYMRSGKENFLTIKYQGINGQVLNWKLSSDFDFAYPGRLVVRNDGVYVAGKVYVPFNNRLGRAFVVETIKYSLDLTQELWGRQFPDPQKVQMFGETNSYSGITSGGNVSLADNPKQLGVWVVCGVNSSGTLYGQVLNQSDYATIHYDGQGNELWARFRDSRALAMQPNATDRATDVVVDDLGNSYVTGVAGVSNKPPSCMTVKYDLMGQEKWAKLSRGKPLSWMPTMAKDSLGNVFVGGYYSDPITGYDLNFFILGYDPNGNVIAKCDTFNPYGYGYMSLGGFTMDTADNIYVCCDWTDQPQNPGYKVWTLMLTPALKYAKATWTREYVSTAPGNPLLTGGVPCADKTGNVYVSGDLNSNSFLVKYGQRQEPMYLYSYSSYTVFLGVQP